MKSVKQFLHSFGANGKNPDRLKFPSEDGPVTTLDVRPDILVSTKKDFSIKNSCLPEAPGIRMATNASGKPFPVICNVRSKDLKASKLAARNEASPPRSNGVRTFRKCASGISAGVVESESQEGTPVHAIARQPVTLRVSSVPSRQDHLCSGRSLVPPPMVTAALAKRRVDESKVEPEKNVSQNGGTKGQSTYSGVRTLKRAVTERTLLNECATRGDHNVSGLPQQDGLALTRIPRFTAAPPPAIPPRVQKPVAQKPAILRRSTSDISQNGGASNGGAHISERHSGRPAAGGAEVAKVSLKTAASFTAPKTNDGVVTEAQLAPPCLEDGGSESSSSQAERASAAESEEASPATTKIPGAKGKSKSRCQRRIWSFSLPRFMRSHSSPKLNTDSIPGEESRSSTLPRLKSTDDADLSALGKGSSPHLFKITSLTSLHDLSGHTPPKTCFSQGDINQTTTSTKTTEGQRIVNRQQDEEVRSGNGVSQEAKKSCSLAESHSSSDNGTDNGGPERPYVMPPRALRKYIKTNFRRLNMQDGVEADTVKKDGDAALKIIAKEDPIPQQALSATSEKDVESLPSRSSLSSCSDSARTVPNDILEQERDSKEPEVSIDSLAKVTEQIVADHSHTASHTKENSEECLSKTHPSLLSAHRLSPPMTCFDVDAEVFSEHADIHRAIPATVRLITAANAALSVLESPGQGATPTPRAADAETGGAGYEPLVRVLATSAGIACAPSLDVSDSCTQGPLAHLSTTGNSEDGCASTTDSAPLANGAPDVPEELERQVDGASCSESLSSFESEVALPDRQERKAHGGGHTRKLRVLDRPTCGAGAAVARNKCSGGVAAGSGIGCCCSGASACSNSRSSRAAANNKRHSCGDRVRQLENDVWQAERELLLIKEKLLRGHGRHSSRPTDKSKSDRDKGGGSHRANGTAKVATESTEVQCDASSNPESSPFLHVQDELLSKVPGAEGDATRRVHEENLLLQQELKEKCDLLSKLEEELDHRDDATALEALDRTTTPLSLNHRPQQREELRVTQEALSSLRQCFRLDDPYQHTLDTIEQSLCTLLERVTCMEKLAAAATACPSTGSLSAASARRLNFDSTGDPRRLPITTLEDFPGYRTDPPASLGQCSQPASTKVIYYTERSVTPFLSAIPKRLSDIRLRDFKVVFDRPGQYRYHFKTLDPEFGMVKEEVLHDDDRVPGWDGKIVAWIEEDI
ncbi:uncharacterized protein LOC142582475 isoform X1 [Dermacentor variabilis]|uniref:uncharacterized protein LOC142582475 isoform X1 n=1 Tax=Dermacentor variabilis TaxID=34621 RepID=UPI003F5B0C42